MISNTKSSITLPAEEVRAVQRLKDRIGARSNVEVVRRALRLLEETTDREAMREAYANAARAVRASTVAELEELDHLSGEGLDE